MLSKTPKPLNRFNSLPINEQQRGRMDRIRQLVKRLFLESRHLCPEGRYLDQAHEQLEIVHMLLNKSISHDWEGSPDQIATDDPVLAPSFDVEALCEALDADVPEPDYPIEAVDQELRDMGVDPDEVGQRGEELVQGLLAERDGKPLEDQVGELQYRVDKLMRENKMWAKKVGESAVEIDRLSALLEQEEGAA